MAARPARMADTGVMTRTHTAAAPAVTLAGQRIELLDRARVYACGITPYDVTHLGHAATFTWVDTLVRTLRFLGVEPEVCRNVTDVDDVLDAAAGRAGAAYDTFAAIQQFQPHAGQHHRGRGGGMDSGHDPSVGHPGLPRGHRIFPHRPGLGGGGRNAVK